MELNKIEKQILIDIYEFDINHEKTIKRINYELVETNNHEKNQEFASYLLNLKRLKYIEFDEKATLFIGGQNSLKYYTCYCMFRTQNIHIKEKGIEFVKEVLKSDEKI